MAAGRQLEWVVVGVILVTLAASGAAFGTEAGGTGDRAGLGAGDASVTVESLPTERLHIDRGRFGTDVLYLRIPDATVHVSDVQDSPLLRYRIEVPALGVDANAERVLRSDVDGTVRIQRPDVAFDPTVVDQDEYDATVTVRVQSFAVDRTVHSVNETVEVER